MCGSGLKRCHPRGGEDLLDCSKRILTCVRMTNSFLTPHTSHLTTHNSQLNRLALLGGDRGAVLRNFYSDDFS